MEIACRRSKADRWWSRFAVVAELELEIEVAIVGAAAVAPFCIWHRGDKDLIVLLLISRIVVLIALLLSSSFC